MESRIGFISFGLLAIFAVIGIVAFIFLRRRRIGALIALTSGVAIVLVLFLVTCLTLRLEASTTFKLIAWLLMAALGSLLIVCALWLVARFFAWLGASDPAGGTVNPEERQRIIAMVEQGKMTAQEGAELLDALGKSSALRGQQTFGRLDVAILVAVAVVVLGFFLPWQYINMNGREMYQSGHQIGAQGWAVLICAILAALVVFITPKEYLYKLVLLQVLSVCVGLALIVSVWWNAGENVGAGTVICCLGFAFVLLASGMKLKALGR
jgi:hypothetical protein